MQEMAEYKHGSMDIHAQVDTFEGFVKIVKWAVITIMAILVFLAIFAV
jgi:Bacterial aa3 type cytochrome c oxidase subunit IV